MSIHHNLCRSNRRGAFITLMSTSHRPLDRPPESHTPRRANIHNAGWRSGLVIKRETYVDAPCPNCVIDDIPVLLRLDVSPVEIWVPLVEYLASTYRLYLRDYGLSPSYYYQVHSAQYLLKVTCSSKEMYTNVCEHTHRCGVVLRCTSDSKIHVAEK